MRSRIIFKQESGQTMAEYGVILSIITAAIISALILFTGKIAAAYQRVVDLI